VLGVRVRWLAHDAAAAWRRVLIEGHTVATASLLLACLIPCFVHTPPDRAYPCQEEKPPPPPPPPPAARARHYHQHQALPVALACLRCKPIKQLYAYRAKIWHAPRESPARLWRPREPPHVRHPDFIKLATSPPAPTMS
jgi:hypothetical protein